MFLIHCCWFRVAQKKGLSPNHCQTEIKYAKSVSFVSPCPVAPVPSIPIAAESPPGKHSSAWVQILGLSPS